MFDNFTGKAFMFFNTIFKDTDKRNSILDPFTCIIRLAILSFKPVGTKISIHNNKISYHDPNMLQGALRWTYGDNREDLHNIYNPIRKVIEWYNLSLPEIKGICDYSINGINILKSSYNQHTIISHTLEHYINILEEALKKENNVSDLSKSTHFFKDGEDGEDGEEESSDTEESEEEVLDLKKNRRRNNNEDKNSNINNTNLDESSSSNIKKNIYKNIETNNINTIYTSFRKLYSQREIVIIYNILLEMSNNAGKMEIIEGLTNSLNSILDMKEKEVYKIILESSTILD